MSSESKSDFSSVHGSGWNVSSACIHPLYNLFVSVSEVVLTVDLPYVNEKSLKLHRSSQDSLELYAETVKKITFKELGAKHRHGEFTCYRAMIRMPVPVNHKRATKKFKRGLLEVHIPRIK
jgi:HSP20 family molecular chaperone IbpA